MTNIITYCRGTNNVQEAYQVVQLVQLVQVCLKYAMFELTGISYLYCIIYILYLLKHKQSCKSTKLCWILALITVVLITPHYRCSTVGAAQDRKQVWFWFLRNEHTHTVEGLTKWHINHSELFIHNDHCYMEACMPDKTMPAVKYEGGSIMLWGCLGGSAALHITICRIIEATSQDISEDVKLGQKWVFAMSKHNAQQITDWFNV